MRRQRRRLVKRMKNSMKSSLSLKRGGRREVERGRRRSRRKISNHIVKVKSNRLRQLMLEMLYLLMKISFAATLLTNQCVIL